MKKSSQSNNNGLTTKVKGLLKDQLESEKLCVEKYTEYAQKANDPELKQLFNEIAQSEQSHYDSIQQMLNGTVPNMNTGNSNSATYTNTSTNSTGSSKGANQNAYVPDAAANPIIGETGLFSSYTGGGSIGSYVNQSDGNMNARSYENTLHPDDLVVGGGGVSYSHYGVSDGGPQNNTGQNQTSYSNSQGQNTGASYQGQTGDSYNQNPSNNYTDCDKSLCTDMLMTEKHVSSVYNTTIFECTDCKMRDALNHIQKEEQQHGEKLFSYMQKKGLYQVNS